MKSGALLLWLALFGSDGNVPPAAFTDAVSVPVKASATWIGEWLVGGERRTVRAILKPVAGREQLAGHMTFGEGRGAVMESWIGSREGRWLRLTRSGVGGARLSATEGGHLVGYLIRLDAAGDLELSPLQ